MVGTQDRIDKLLAELQTRMEPGLDGEVQKQLAEIVELLPRLGILDDSTLVGSVEVAVSAALADPPNLRLAQAIQVGLEKRARRASSPLFRFTHGQTPPTRVV